MSFTQIVASSLTRLNVQGFFFVCFDDKNSEFAKNIVDTSVLIPVKYWLNRIEDCVLSSIHSMLEFDAIAKRQCRATSSKYNISAFPKPVSMSLALTFRMYFARFENVFPYVSSPRRCDSVEVELN